MKKILLICMTLVIVSSMFAIGTSDNKNAAPSELYIYNSKGENAKEFAAMAAAFEKETGIKVRVFSIGAGQDHMEPLRAEMNSSKKPTIFSIQGLKELQEWKEAGYALDFSKLTNAEFKKLADGISPSLRLTLTGADSYGIPYNVEGYGFIADKQMLSDLFGLANADTLINDIKTSSYDEWDALVKGINAYIKNGTVATVKLSGKDYAFVPAKTGLAKNLNGVFSVMGSEKWTYGDHFINVALNAVFASPAAAYNATTAQINALKGPFLAYAKALDQKTSYLAGLNGAGVRGRDFVSSSKFGYDQAVQIFADSKAVFFKQGNWAFGNIAGVNPEMAKRLVFLPVKMPFTASDITAPRMNIQKMNASIPVFVPNYYAVNAKASVAEQELAMKFLVWLNTSTTGKKFIVEDFAFIPYNADPATTNLPNSLGNSILDYIKRENTLAAPYHGAPASWSGDVVGLKLLESYMTKEKWTNADYDAIAEYAITQWKALK